MVYNSLVLDDVVQSMVCGSMYVTLLYVWCMVCMVLWWWWTWFNVWQFVVCVWCSDVCMVYGALVVVNHCHRQEVTLSSPPLHELPSVSYK